MVVRYEHASEERDALLAQALNASRWATTWCHSRMNSQEIARVKRATRVRSKVRWWSYRR